MRLILSTLFTLFTLTASAQCDVELVSVDWETGEVVIYVLNSEGCGDEGMPDNMYINNIVLGVTNGDSILNDYEFAYWPEFSFLDYQNQSLTGALGVYAYTGDTININLAGAVNANYGDPTIISLWNEWYNDGTFCDGAALIITQINFSNGFYPVVWGVQQDYPDVTPQDNIIYFDGICPCDTITEYVDVIEYLTDTLTVIEYVGDTVVEYITDTVTENWYFTDTIVEYIETTVWDTLVEVDTVVIHYVEYVTDTLEVIEYIEVETTVWDTLIEYVIIVKWDTLEIVTYEYIELEVEVVVYEYELSYVNCESPCDGTSVYAPSAVTPDGDGLNETWQVMYDTACDLEFETRIYNRWGDLVWIGQQDDVWYADVADGLYVFSITIWGVEVVSGSVVVLS